MNFKLEKTDLYLILIYFGFAVPIGLLDWDYDNWTHALLERMTFVMLNTTTLYVVVFVLIAKFLPKRKFLLLFVVLLPFLVLMGIISIQLHCSMYECEGNLFSFDYIYMGTMARIDEIGLLATFIAGKKIYETQVHFYKIEKEKKQSELQSLKAQIDPHFLFNNLNTVDALIDSNPQNAKEYINKLAQLYRYLIANKDFEVVSLEEELAFAQNYIYLIACRFGEAYQFDIQEQQKEDASFLIPPGALQTLLENIVKHNKTTSLTPVKTTIQVLNDRIIVSNELKKKQVEVLSSGIGLSNLKTRYELLGDQALKITVDDYFTVELPAIKQVD